MIRLTIIKAPDIGTHVGSDAVFGPGGGTIGRSRSSTWSLIDNDFLISRTHAEIHVDNGQYFVTDKSTNGLFLNQARKSLGFGETAPLRNGDQMHLGRYTMAITLETPQQSSSQEELGGAAFLYEATPHEPKPFEPAFTDVGAIPNNWLREADFFSSSATGFEKDLGTLVTSRGDDLPSASWFENSLRMMLAPVIGSGISTMPASDLISLVTQLARAATGSKTTSESTAPN